MLMSSSTRTITTKARVEMTKEQIRAFYLRGDFTWFKAMHYLMLIGVGYMSAWRYLERSF